MGRWSTVLVVVLALLLVAGCGGGDDRDGTASRSAAAPGEAPGDVSGASPAASAAGGAAAPGDPAAGGSTVRLVDLSNRIIKQATLELDIDRGQLSSKLSEATRIVARHEGISVSSSTSAPERGAALGRVTFRVPVQEYDATVADLAGLGRYRHEQSDSRDVAGDVVDLDAQIVALKAQERTYLRLLDRTRSIADVLAVERQLVQVRRDLERLEGQLRVLEDRADFSTIELRLREPGAVAAASRGTFASAWRVALRGLEIGAATVLVGLVWLVPIAVLAVLSLVLLRLARRQRPPAAAAAAPGTEG